MRGHRKALTFALVLACLTPVAVSAAVSPAALYGSIVGAARSERSVHYVSAVHNGAFRMRQVGDVGVTQGIQHNTFRIGPKAGSFTDIVSANTAYIRADSFSLVQMMGFNATAAAKYAGVWILIPRSDRHYSAVAEAVTFRSAIAELTLLGPLTSVPDTEIAGHRVVGVRGKQRSSYGEISVATLYTRASGSPLPVEEVSTFGKARLTVTLSKWNQPVHVATPANAVPMSTIGPG